MRASRFGAIIVALAMLASKAAWTEEAAPTYPTGPEWSGEFAQPELSGVFNPLRINVRTCRGMAAAV